MPVGHVIGKQLLHGFAGGYAIQPDMLVSAHVNNSDETILFGELLIYDDNLEGVKPCREDPTNKKFAGIASREVKQSNVYSQQDLVGFAPKEAVNCFHRGIISICCQEGSPKFGGDVYYRYTSDNPDSKPIGFVAAEDTSANTKAVKITGLQFAGTSDANGIVAVSINEKMHV